jgi:hypothetical protein
MNHVCATRVHRSRIHYCTINRPSHIGYNRRLSDHFACKFISFVLCEKSVPLPCRRRRRRAARGLSRRSRSHMCIVSRGSEYSVHLFRMVPMEYKVQTSRVNCYAEPESDILADFCMNCMPISFSAIVLSRRDEARRCIGKHTLLTERQPSEPLRPPRAPFVRFLFMP